MGYSIKIICDYCTEFYHDKHCGGNDGIMYDAKENKYYFVAEHFRNECVQEEINYCPMCGRKLD